MIDPIRRALLASFAFGLLWPRSACSTAGADDAPRERVSVRDFGARGDGAADDSAAINAAIRACRSGQELFFPPGNYLVSVSGGGEQALTPFPSGVDVVMDPAAWIFPSTRDGRGDQAITVFTPRGSNKFRVNIDGRSPPERSAVESADWINNSHGIRAYANAAHGLGASDVTIEESRFRNLRFARSPTRRGV